MIALTSVDLFNILRQKIGEAEAKAVTEYIDIQVVDKFESERKILATKDDISSVKLEISKLDVKISETKADLLKWMIVLFAPFYIGMIIFLVKAFIK